MKISIKKILFAIKNKKVFSISKNKKNYIKYFITVNK
jgi:hypothetical protein